MVTRPLSGRDEARVKAMNKVLYPARIRVKPSGAFMIDYRKNGKQIRRVIGYELEEAYEKALIIRREVDQLPVVTSRKLTLAHWYEEWSLKRFQELSPSTVDQYRRSWAKLSCGFRGRKMESLTATDIRVELSRIDRPSMREHVAVFLSTLLKRAQAEGLIQTSPWKASYTIRPKSVPVVPIEKLVAIIDVATPYIRPALALAAFCGMRRGEIMALTAGDLDLTLRRVYVTKSRVRIFGSEHACDHEKSTKTGRDRFIPIPRMALPFLETALAGKGPDERLYHAFYGNVRKALKTACRKVKAPDLTLHGLRHNCISHLVMKGDLKLAQMIAGHSRIQTTADRYTHLLPDYVQKQVEEVFRWPANEPVEAENSGAVRASLSPVVTGDKKRT